MLATEETRLPVPEDWVQFSQKALHWAASFPYCVLLDSNGYSSSESRVEWLLAADALEVYESSGAEPTDWEELFSMARQGTLFGRLSFDLYQTIHHLPDERPSSSASGLHFFRPRFCIQKSGDFLLVNRRTPEALALLEAIEKTPLPADQSYVRQGYFQTDRETYCRNVQQIQEQIREGDFYELNYCIRHVFPEWEGNPVSLFLRANARNTSPMSAFYRYGDKYILCTSPERFLQHRNLQLCSQPIKGTIRRVPDKTENDLLCEALSQNEKERAENIMIVDLVRHDLSQSCKPGSVVVEELCGIHSFRRVNHMISTIRGALRSDASPAQALRLAFPMGSMTGAPKREVLRQIPRWENERRGDYSGSIGYIHPDGDFDFNVVIRSFLYDVGKKELSFWAGSAITWDADAGAEWEEILLKSAPLIEAIYQTGEE